jgi:N-acetyl-anhydromuramyl-L-alanine amidase AmpD
MDPKNIKWITIHCAATPAGRNDSAEKITGMDLERFGQPSYHYVIELDGTVHQTLQHSQVGAHVAGANHCNIGICYVGGMNNAMTKPMDTRTDLQKRAMADLVRKLKAQYPHVVIRGHRDWPHVMKACPSFDVSSWLKSEKI